MQNKPTKRYWDAYASLYGNAEFEVKTKAPPKKSDIPTEAHEQILSVVWLEKNNILFYHIPNGGKRNPLEAIKFKRMGVKAGIPDLCIPIPRKGYHGLYIELKRRSGGKVTDHQEYWVEQLRKNGYAVYVAQGADELITIVKNYMELV